MKTSTLPPDPHTANRVRVQALVVHAMCGDGKIRKVRLRPGHAAKLHTWLKNASVGQVTLFDVPVAIVAAEPKKSLVDKVRDTMRKLRAPRPVHTSQVTSH